MHSSNTADDAVRRRLDIELRLVEEAIQMVAAKAAPRVDIAGLRLGDTVLEPARRMADEAGVRIVPLWTIDEQHLDIRVEAIEP
jgi:hypothetical protein